MAKNKEAQYFPHDYNARTDEKIVSLIMEMGFEGYGLYWAIVEILYNNNNKLKADFKKLSFNLQTEAEKVEKVVKNFDLFFIKDDFFFSNSVKRRLKKIEQKSIQAKDAAFKSWQSRRNADALHEQSESNAINKGNKEIKKGGVPHPTVLDSTAKKLMEHRHDLTVEAAKVEAVKLLEKYPSPGISLIEKWAQNIREVERIVKMRNPQTSQEVEWKESKYEKLKDTTSYTFLGYAN